jgi:uncharacterized protein YerC
MYRVHWTHNHMRFMSDAMTYEEAQALADRIRLDPTCANVEVRLA